MSAAAAHLDWFDLCGKELEGGRYRVDRVVGSGSFGIVYHAMEKGLGPVAIKCLKVPPSLQPHAKESFLQQLRHEAKYLRELSSLHAGIPQAHGAGTLTTPLGEWVPYLVLEWLSGQSLDDLIKSLGGAGMPLIEAVELLDQGASALAAIHEAGVAHRDVKPANMFVVGDAKRRRTKVLDFGVAKALDDHLVLGPSSVAGPPSGGRTGVFTPAYGAPEQFNPELGRTGPHTDVFALALVLIELAGGRPGLEGNHFLGLAQCALSRDVRPSLRGRGVLDPPSRVEQVIEKAVAVDIGDRYADVGAFWSALRAALRTVVKIGSDAETLGSTTPSLPEAASAISRRPRELSAVFVHAEQDGDIALELRDELVPLLSGSVSGWHSRPVGQRDGNRRPGTDTEQAQLVLILLTKALVDSGYCESAEMSLYLQRHRRGEVRVVPVMVRRIFGWRRSPFGDIIAVPRFSVPITQWHDRNLAWKDIAESLRVICRDLQYAVPAYLPPPPKRILLLGEVFKKSDVPTVTFVDTDEYRELRTCLLEPGRGLVIEGPSGVGKTTALIHAAKDAQEKAGSSGAAELVLLNAWSEADEEKIATLPAWHKRGIVAIDNFHSLEPGVAAKVIKHAKFLADAQQTDRKIVIVGIPGSRQSFADSGSDVPRRFDQIRFGRARTDDILRMIEKGEDALGVSIARKSDIAVAAAGSIHLAQVICYWICHANRVEKTQLSHRTLSWSVRELFERMLSSLRDNFKRLIIEFGSLGDKHDVTAVKILKALPACEDGLLPLGDLHDPNDPALAFGVDNLLTQGHIANLYRKPDPDRDRLLYYDARRQALLVENPQLTFYLAHERIANLAREAGRHGVFDRPRIIIHHSPHDAVPGNDWLNPVRESLRDLTDNDGEVSSVPVTVGGKLMSDVGRLASNATALILLVTDNYAGSFKSLDDLRRVLQEHTHPKLKVFPLMHAPVHGAAGLLKAFPPVSATHVASLGSAERLSVYRELLEAVRDHVHKSRLIDA